MDDWKAKQAAKAAAAAALAAANPHLVSVAKEGDSLRAAAKNIRIELARAFPGVKFSVKSRRFSGGDAIDVSWIDGPVSAQVAPIIDKYSAGYFNGMEDIYEYSADAWNHAFGDAKYVHASRSMSDAAIAKAIRLVSSKYALPAGVDVSVASYRSGALWSVPFDGGWGKQNLQELIAYYAYRQCYALDKSPKPVAMSDDGVAA